MIKPRRYGVAFGLGALTLVGVPAWAFVDVSAQQPAQVVAGVLKPPGVLSTSHVSPDSANPGTVRLNWSRSTSPGTLAATTFSVQRRPAGTSSAWTPVSGSAPCTTPVCTYDDDTALVGSSYEFRVTAQDGNWTAGPGGSRVAVSAAVQSVVERRSQYSLNSVAAEPGAASAPQAHLVAVGTSGILLGCDSQCNDDLQANWHLVPVPTGTPALNRVVFDASPGSTRAWAVGDSGAVLTCPSTCASQSASWVKPTGSFASTANLQGVYANGSYVVLVGGSRTVLFSTDSGASWSQQSPVTVSSSARLLYDVAGSGPTDLVIVGSGGYLGVCTPLTGSGVCGQSSRSFSPIASPVTVTLKAVAWRSASGGGYQYLAVDSSGEAIASGSPTISSSWSLTTAAPLATDLLDVVFNGGGSATAVGRSGVVGVCTSPCPVGGAWTSEPSGSATVLNGIASVAGDRWLVGNASTSGPTIRHYGSSWVGQQGPPLVFPHDAAVLSSIDGTTQSVDTTTTAVNTPWPSACSSPNLRATVIIPPSAPGVLSPSFRVSLAYKVATAVTNGVAVTTSLDGGATWGVPVTLPAATTVLQTKTVTVPDGVNADVDSARTVDLCLMGRRGGGTLSVDLLHVDVEQ